MICLLIPRCGIGQKEIVRAVAMLGAQLVLKFLVLLLILLVLLTKMMLLQMNLLCQMLQLLLRHTVKSC